ncbi:unnamed protein product, partial [marine sediment metagenome]
MSYSPQGRNPFQGGLESEALEALTPLMRYRNVYPAEDPRRSVVYHVDCRHGDDGYDGLTWDSPVETIARAIALNNATIDWAKTPKHYNSILIRPGKYPENLESLPYYCSLIGAGGVGQEMAKINPADGSVVTGNPNMVGCHLANLNFEVNEAVPILDIGDCNSNLIEDCLFTVGADVVPTSGIDTEDCTYLILKRNRFLSGRDSPYAIGIAINHATRAHACLYYDNFIAATI